LSEKFENSNFDKFFRERYSQHEVSPPNELWDKVNEDLFDSSAADFDEQIRDRYAGHETSPPGHLWRKIGLEAAASKTGFFLKRISLLKWFSLGAIAIVTGIAVMVLLNNNKSVLKEPIETQQNIDQEKQDIPGKQEEALNFISDNSHDITEQQRLQKKMRTFTDDEPTTSKIPELGVINENSEENNFLAVPDDEEEKPNVYGQSLTDKDLLNNTDHAGQKNQKTDKSAQLNNNEIEQISIVETESQFVESDNNVNIHSFDEATNKTRADDSSKPIVIRDNTPAANNNSLPGNRKIKSRKKSEIPITKTVADTLKFESKQNKKKRNDEEPSAFNEYDSRVSLTVFLSPTYSDRTLKSEQYPEFAKFYNEVQKGEWYLFGGASVGYYVTKNWMINLGISQSKLNQEFELNNVSPAVIPPLKMDGIKKTITVWSSLGMVQATNLDKFEFAPEKSDLKDVRNYYPINYREEHKFTFLNFPLTARYLTGSQKVKLIIDGGFIATWVISSESKIEIATIKNPSEVVVMKDYHNTNNFGLRITAGMGMQYDFSQWFSLLFLPSFNYSLINLNQNDYSVIKPYEFKLSVGVQYRF